MNSTLKPLPAPEEPPFAEDRSQLKWKPPIEIPDVQHHPLYFEPN